MRRRGFTLIELLVVIAIIGLLSSVVLASLNSARAKARNAERLSLLNQYILALELSYDAYGSYPVTDYKCLGKYPPDGVCFVNRIEHVNIINALSPYMPSLQGPPAPPNLPDYDGFVYNVCPGPGICSVYTVPNYAIQWLMEGSTASCGPGFRYASTFYEDNDATLCIYIHQ